MHQPLRTKCSNIQVCRGHFIFNHSSRTMERWWGPGGGIRSQGAGSWGRLWSPSLLWLPSREVRFYSVTCSSMVCHHRSKATENPSGTKLPRTCEQKKEKSPSLFWVHFHGCLSQQQKAGQCGQTKQSNIRHFHLHNDMNLMAWIETEPSVTFKLWCLTISEAPCLYF